MPKTKSTFTNEKLSEMNEPKTIEPKQIVTQIDPIEKLIYSITNGTAEIKQDERTKARIAHIRLASGALLDVNLDCGDIQHLRNRLFSLGVTLG